MKFTEIVQYVDEQTDTHTLSQEGQIFWKIVTIGLIDFAEDNNLHNDITVTAEQCAANVSSLSETLFLQMHNLALKAKKLIGQNVQAGVDPFLLLKGYVQAFEHLFGPVRELTTQ